MDESPAAIRANRPLGNIVNIILPGIKPHVGLEVAGIALLKMFARQPRHKIKTRPAIRRHRTHPYKATAVAPRFELKFVRLKRLVRTERRSMQRCQMININQIFSRGFPVTLIFDGELNG